MNELNSNPNLNMNEGTAASGRTGGSANSRKDSLAAQAHDVDSGTLSSAAAEGEAGAIFETKVPFVLEEAVDQIRGYVEKANDFIQKRPITVLGAACAVGMAAAFILSAREEKLRGASARTTA